MFLAGCDIVYFSRGWSAAARRYGLCGADMPTFYNGLLWWRHLIFLILYLKLGRQDKLSAVIPSNLFHNSLLST